MCVFDADVRLGYVCARVQMSVCLMLLSEVCLCACSNEQWCDKLTAIVLNVVVPKCFELPILADLLQNPAGHNTQNPAVGSRQRERLKFHRHYLTHFYEYVSILINTYHHLILCSGPRERSPASVGVSAAGWTQPHGTSQPCQCCDSV